MAHAFSLRSIVSLRPSHENKKKELLFFCGRFPFLSWSMHIKGHHIHQPLHNVFVVVCSRFFFWLKTTPVALAASAASAALADLALQPCLTINYWKNSQELAN